MQIDIILNFSKNFIIFKLKNWITQLFLLRQIVFTKYQKSDFQKQFILAESIEYKLPSLIVWIKIK